MIKDTTRTLTDSERLCLQKRLDALCPVSGRDTARWSLLWAGGLILLVLLAAGLIALRPNPVLGGIVGGILFVAAIICFYALCMVISGFFRWRRYYREFIQDTAPVIRRVLQENRCLSRDVKATEVYEIEEFEDEGPGYIFALGDGKSLLLKGQKYIPAKDQMPWPACEFSLVRSTDGIIWVGLFSSGEGLPASKTIKMEECTEEFIWSEREDVLDGKPDDILKGIMKSGQPSAAGYSMNRGGSSQP